MSVGTWKFRAWAKHRGVAVGLYTDLRAGVTEVVFCHIRSTRWKPLLIASVRRLRFGDLTQPALCLP